MNYFVCATPRTGSSLLLGLLASTGLAGRPEAYFRDPDEGDRARRWGIAGPDDSAFDYRQFVGAAREAGTTPNGVFGAKLMWGTLDEVVAKLAPDTTGADRAVLTGVFGPLSFVYLRREDEVAQAVSWLRAEQTQITYEQLTADLAGTTRGVLAFLGLDPDAGQPVRPRHRRQGDRLNDDWAGRYRSTTGRTR